TAPPALLATLQEFGPASQAALSRRTGIYRSDLVAVVNELTSRGLIDRASDPADRRRNVITITPRGRRYLRRLSGRVSPLPDDPRTPTPTPPPGRRCLRRLDGLVAAVQEDLLAPLTPPERDQLVRLLTRLLD